MYQIHRRQDYAFRRRTTGSRMWKDAAEDVENCNTQPRELTCRVLSRKLEKACTERLLNLDMLSKPAYSVMPPCETSFHLADFSSARGRLGYAQE